MALHRDIHWIGRQWAVTGFGMQAIDQRLSGQFDIEISRLWEGDLAESLRDQKWFNAEDFNKGLSAARQRYPEPPFKAAPPEAAPVPKNDGPIEPPEPAPQNFAIGIKDWPAKFVRPWRIRIQR
jgi:hypothetical protein